MLSFIKTHIITISCLLASCALLGQNLIKNPSFDYLRVCPKELGNFDRDIETWSTPTKGTTDYFHSCSSYMGVPKNYNGNQAAKFGKGYAGLYMVAPGDYREYIQAEISEPLIVGETYRFSFYISLAEKADFMIKDFGVLFSEKPINVNTRKMLSRLHLARIQKNALNYTEINNAAYYNSTKDWTLVSMEWLATGKEKYVTLGNFRSNARTRKKKLGRNMRQGAYYYLDMVALEQITDTPSIVLDGDREGYELDKTHVFQNVLFDFDRFKLLEEAHQDLKDIYAYLDADLSLQITINGYTDNIGSEEYNLALSTKRARAVANHLIGLGLSKGRIQWKGYGGKNPIKENNTEAGRQQNRRVEFIISQQTEE